MADIFAPSPAPPLRPEPPGLFTRLTDIFATPQRVVLGAAEAIMTGGDIGEGVSEALASRRTFGDIFREQGVDPRAAGVLGLGAGILTDPINLIPAGAVVGMVARGAREGGVLARTTLRAGMPRPLSQVLADTPKLTAAASTAELRASAARGAFRKVIPAGQEFAAAPDAVRARALADAKRAAAQAGAPPDPNDLVVQGNFARNMLDRAGRAVSKSRFVGLFRDAQRLRRTFVSNLATSLRKDVEAFGEGGPEIADLLVRSEQVADKLEGERVAFYWNTIRPLLKTEAERINFTEIAGGEAVRAANPKVQEAVRLYREFDNQIFGDAREIGLRELVPQTHSVGQGELFPEVVERAKALAKENPAVAIPVPIQFRQNHVPHFYKKEAIAALKRESPERAAAINNLVENGLAQNKDDAARALDEMLHAEDSYFTPVEFRGGPLQFSRELMLSLPWEKDPDKWFPRYSHIASRRLAQGAVFGPQDEKFASWLSAVREGGGDYSRAYNIYRLASGRPTRELSRFRETASAIGAGQTILWLGWRTGMLQFMQLANSVGAFGFGNTFRALGATIFSPDTRRLAAEVGALLPSGHMSWEGDIATSWSSWYLHHLTLMPQSDRAVRVTSGMAGMLAARQWAEGLTRLTGRTAATAERALTRLGIDPAAVSARGGQLTIAEMQSAFLNGANYTQFASHLSDMPEAWKTPIGRFMYKFRAFSKQQSRFVGTLVDEAMKGNPKPLMRYLAVYPALYSAARPVLDFLAGKHSRAEEESAKDYLRGLLFTGTLGGLGDFFTNVTANDPARVSGILTGPAVSQAANTIVGLSRAAEGNLEPLRRAIGRPAVLRPLELLTNE